MHHHFRRAALAPVALAFSTVLAAPLAEASPVASFDFDDTAMQFENAADFAAPGLNASAWIDIDGTLTNFAGNPGKALGAKSFHDGNTLHFTLTVAPGLVLSLAGFGFEAQASSTGPTVWTLSVAGDALASGATTGSFQANGGSFGERRFTGAIDVAVSGSGATAASGTFRIDNFVLDGRTAPVPVPAAVWLALVPAAAMLGRRRPA